MSSTFTVIVAGLAPLAEALEGTGQFAKVQSVASTSMLRDLLRSGALSGGVADKVFFFADSTPVDTQQSLAFLIQGMTGMQARVVIVATSPSGKELVKSCPGAGLLEGPLKVNTVLGALFSLSVPVAPVAEELNVDIPLTAAPAAPAPAADPFGAGPAANPFGAPAAPAPAPQAANPFATPEVPTAPAAPAAPAVAEPAPQAANPFGTPAPQADNPFAAPAPPAAPAAPEPAPQASNPFGAPAAQDNPFGAPAPRADNPFAAAPAAPAAPEPAPQASNPFGAPAAQDNPFAAPPAPAVQDNPFAAPVAAEPAPQATNPFGAPATAQGSPFGAPAAPEPAAAPFGMSAPAAPAPQATNPFGAPAAHDAPAFGAPVPMAPAADNPFAGAQHPGFGAPGFGAEDPTLAPPAGAGLSDGRPVRRADAPVTAPAQRRGFVITVTAPKGGTGKSTLSLNLAAYLGLRLQGTGKNVCIIDANVQQADTGKYLSQFAPNVEDVLKNPSAIHPDRINDYLLHRPELNMSALLGPMTPDAANPAWFSGRRYSQILDTLRPNYDYIIVDTPVAELYHDLFREFALPQADFIAVAITPNYTTLMNTDAWLRQVCAPQNANGMGIDRDKVGIILNRAEDGIGFTEDEVRRDLGEWRFLGSVPETKEWKRCNNEGELVATKNYHELNEAFSGVLVQATGEAILQTTPANLTSDGGLMTKLRGLFGKG